MNLVGILLTENIMSYLNQLYKNNLKENNFYIIPLIICLSTIPLKKLGFNNLALALFIVSIIINFKVLKFNKNKALILPIAYFIWSLISLIWTYNIEASNKAILKEIGLLLFPLIFLFLPKFKQKDTYKILSGFSYLMAIYAVFLLITAFIKFLEVGDFNVFFYHELVTLEVNAIYISIIFSLAFLFILRSKLIRWWDYLSALILFITIILLSSKNIIIITSILALGSFFVFRKKIQPKKIVILIGLAILIIAPLSSKIIERFNHEMMDINENVILENGVENISLRSAWYQEKFTHNNYFSGTSLRIYQTRLLKEFIEEDHIFFKGFGINAAQNKIKEKQEKRGYIEYFGDLNFHNQYLQSFAELGIIGCLIYVLMIITSIFKSIRTKDYNFLCFSILIFSLSFTEAILSRQRGIMLFIILYCIYHQLKKDENVTK